LWALAQREKAYRDNDNWTRNMLEKAKGLGG